MKRRCICEYFDRALTMPEIIQEARHPGSVPQITRTNPSQPIDPIVADTEAELDAALEDMHWVCGYTWATSEEYLEGVTALYRMRAELEALADLGRLPRKP